MLVVNDGEINSVPAAVNVTVSDFLIAAPTAPITLLRGQSASFNVVLTPKYGPFDEAVAVACGNLPAGVSCSVAGGSVTPGAQGASATVTLTASVSATRQISQRPVFAFWLAGLPLFGVLFIDRRKRKAGRICFLLLIALGICAGMMACGGGGGTGSAGPSTPSSASTSITITGTAGGLQHSSTANVIVQ
jgi:hypothetical protein